MKVIGNTPTLISNLDLDFPLIGDKKWLHNHCLEDSTWYSVLQRISGSNSYDFKIITIGVLGP